MGCLFKYEQHPSTGPPTYQIIKVSNANHMNVMKTSLTIFPCVLGSALHHIRVCPGLSFATKRIGPPCCTLFTLLLVTRYKLSYHKTFYYLLFLCLQRIPCWKPLIISFCSSLGSTLLLIERTMIDLLYLWVIRPPRRHSNGAPGDILMAHCQVRHYCLVY